MFVFMFAAFWRNKVEYISTLTTLRRTSVFQPLMQRLQFNNLEDASDESNPGWAATD